ncbi:transmembrane protein, putative (macronuclear) [Tetrahymena thermophila SB210]|uniref:Transmembrane protein, putative n=1 Tax=Tetrahymena thermophila (strain SB210) TaxID=312017 RepID=W7XHV4_TETTS|nr:transmembrane protein, putative [Tetrahymena thermophila SB210]EWS74081.1 transmembrane protein, putative [Tetrahymena thermophila SB210]|eukprot:XP_012653414.1 transmembrane protein, putative [Tetrahymena thermophila SB210]
MDLSYFLQQNGYYLTRFNDGEIYSFQRSILKYNLVHFFVWLRLYRIYFYLYFLSILRVYTIYNLNISKCRIHFIQFQCQLLQKIQHDYHNSNYYIDLSFNFCFFFVFSILI